MNAGFDIDDYVHQHVVRIVSDALQSATAVYWDRRADQFEKALPRPCDYVGRSTAAERAAREERLRIKIAACRNAAAFWRHIATGTPLLDLVATEVERKAAA